MLKEILTVSGRPGLYKLLARGNNCLICESVDETKKRIPVQATDKVVSLGDISIFTDEGELSLGDVFQKIEDKYGKEEVKIDFRKAANDELNGFLAQAVPDYDRDRVYPSHIKKIICWYNILVKTGLNDFADKSEENTGESVAESGQDTSKNA